MDLLSEKSFKGIWWRPNRPDATVPGELSFDPKDGLRLRLIGSLGEWTDEATLHGALVDGEEVTLHRVLSPPSLYTHYAFLGAHLDEPPGSIFSSCSFRLSHLEEWLSVQPFTWNWNSTQPPCRELNLSVRTVDKDLGGVRFIDADLRQRSSINCEAGNPRRALVETRSWLVVAPAAAQSLEWYLTVISRLRNLLTLCFADPPSYVEEVALHAGDSFSNLLYLQSPSIPTAPKPLPASCIIRASELGEDLSSTVSDWLEIHQRLEHALKLFFVYDTGPFIENRFLFLAQALEVFHRHNKGGRMQFKQRLKDMDEAYLKPIGLVRLDKGARSQIASTRDYLIHYSDDPRPDVRYGFDMHSLIQHMVAALAVILLFRLGASPSVLRRWLEARPYFKRAMDLSLAT